jgi:hypothetical protein
MRIVSTIVVLSLCLQASLAVLAPDSRGNDFFVAFGFNLQPGYGQTQDLFISSDNAVQVEISTYTGVLATLAVPAQTTVAYDVSTIYIPAENIVGNYGIRVRTLDPTKEITLVGLNTYPATTDAFLAFPVDVLGIDYYAVSYTACCGVPSYMYVVSTVDGTVVTFSGSHSLDGVGATSSFTLNRYQTVMVGAVNSEISGFRIQSTNPIAVFAGAACADIPVGTYACNVLVDQIPPVNTWASDFITVPIATRHAGDVFRIAASQAGTQITVNGVNIATIGAGQYHEFQSAVPQVIHTSLPAILMQFDKGSGADGASADPFAIWIPPVPQFSANYYISTPLSSTWSNWVSLVVPSGQQSGMNIDGHSLSATWSNVGNGANYVYTQVQISIGSHHVYHSSPIVPFEIISYGFGSYDGYGYVGGNRLAPLQNPCTPTVTVPGDGIDNDCDGKIDEEIRNGIDDDGDTLIDEDLVAETCCSSSTVLPTLTVSGSATSVTIGCSATLPALPVVTGNVDCTPSSAVVTPTITTTGGSCAQDSTVTRKWTVTDSCGRVATLTQVITIVDSVAPVVTAPATANVPCGAATSISALGNAAAADACDHNLAAVTSTDAPSQGACLPVITRTFSSADHCGNVGSATQTINIVDTTGPVVTAPASVTLQCGADSSVASVGAASVSDACFSGLTASHSDSAAASSCLAVGRITRSFSSTDGCGLTGTAQQVITFVDTTAPAISAPAATTVECGYSSAVSITGDATATDACSTTPLVISSSDSFAPTSATCEYTGVITRTFTTSDSCGNVASATQAITIRDTTAPNAATSPQCIFPPNGLSACWPVVNPTYVTPSDVCSDSMTVTYQGCSNNFGNTEGCHFDTVHNQICVDAVSGESYNLQFQITDCSGNSAIKTATIAVPNHNNNCAGFTSCDAAITGVSPSSPTGHITQIDVYGLDGAIPQYRIQVQFTVQEAVLTNWRLEVHFPAPGEDIVEYSQYDIYTDGVFKCESANPDYVVISPAAWAMTVNQGGLITVEYVASNNARLNEAQIKAGTEFFLWTTQ